MIWEDRYGGLDVLDLDMMANEPRRLGESVGKIARGLRALRDVNYLLSGVQGYSGELRAVSGKVELDLDVRSVYRNKK